MFKPADARRESAEGPATSVVDAGNGGQAAPSLSTTSEPATRAGSYAVYILVLLTLANVLSYADRYLFSIAMPAIKQEFGASDAVLGLIGGPAFTVSYILFSIPLARLADRWSRKRVLAISVTVWSAATALCGAAGGIAQMALGRVLVGVGEAGAMPPSQSLISQLFEPRRRATALGCLAVAPHLGLVVGLSGGGVAIALWGWRTTFLVLALAGLPIALLVWLTGPSRTSGPRVATSSTESTRSAWQAVRYCWSIPSLRLLALGTGVFNMFGYAASIWLPAFLMRSHAMTSVQAGFWLGVCATIGGVLGSLSSGAIVDTLVARSAGGRDIRWQLRVPALGFIASFPLQLVFLLLPAGAAITVAGHAVPGVGLLLMSTAFLSSLWMGPSFAAVSRIVAPEYRSQATAMLIVIINVVGSTAGPLIAGLISDTLTPRLGQDALRYSLLSMSALMVVGGAVFWRAATHYPRDVHNGGQAAA